MTTLKIKLLNGTPGELSFRNGQGEKNHGGAVMRIEHPTSMGRIKMEVWISADDRRCIKGWL